MLFLFCIIVLSIQPVFLFGVRSGVNNGGLHFTSPHSLLYPAGSGVGLVNVHNNKQEIISLASKGSQISALAINNTRNLLAFTEYGERPLLVVYDLDLRRKLKLLRCAEFRSDEVVSLAFSHDSKYLLVQGGPPEYQLVYFFWEKGKVITTISRVVSQSSTGSIKDVSFHPKVSCVTLIRRITQRDLFVIQDRDIVCIIGQNVFKMCKLIEGTLRPFGFMKGDGLVCLAHSWLSNKHLLVAGQSGKVILFEEAELKTIYNLNDLIADTEENVQDDKLDSDRNFI